MATTASVPSSQNQATRDDTRQRSRGRPRRGGASRDAAVPNEDVPQPTGQGQGRRGGAGLSQTSRNALLTLRPSSIPPLSQPTSTEPSSAEVSASESVPSQRQGQRRGQRGGSLRQERGNSHQAHTHHGQRTAHGRQFGGRLTTDHETALHEAASSASPLQADAPEFRPGQPPVQRAATRAVPPRQQQRQRRASKSTAPDIATRTHEDISNGHYECPICTNDVQRSSKVWSCKTCWTVFHLSCIKRWSTNEGSAASQRHVEDGQLPPPRQWRCPGCNLPQDVRPTTYVCWCEKEVEPRSISGLPPHSCGQTCGKPRVLPKKCPHPCELICHAGPCPPCTHVGPIQSCFCGKEATSRRCIDTDYESGWSCGQICGDLMPCGEHTCDRECHEGLCGACEVGVDARCYCGQEAMPILCCERGQEKESKRSHLAEDGQKITESWIGQFECAQICDRPFDCGKHRCEKPCHAQEVDIEHCPRSPDLVSHCPCGKTKVTEISSVPRISCEDPIPNCTKPCLKPLSCGHPCTQVCHSGECLPCLKTVSISCRCGRTTSSTICHQGVEEAPQCTRVCRTTLNCGRHACDERCCPGERKATERLSVRRKQRPLSSAPRPADEGFEAEHICTRPCGRLLKCGSHYCDSLCHKGPCGSCREAIFTDISCNCGRTVLTPPLPCGTQPPPCRFPCNRPKLCGHPQVQHNCHLDDESCPKCPFLTEKRCLCGKRTLKNQPCWRTEGQCGETCGKKLRCGSHFCRKQCHRPRECEDAGGKACQQPCGKAKRACGHPCEDTCHAPYPCKEEKSCTHKIFVTCQCQNLKQEMRCAASRTSEGNNSKSLPCNDECTALARKRQIALALSINPETHVDGGDHIPYASETLSLYQRENAQWAQTQEKEFRIFALDTEAKRLRFKPMPPSQRAFLHALADDYGLDSESMDPEPHRHVAVFKTPRFVAAPNKTLSECVRIRQLQRASAAPADDALPQQQRKRAGNEFGEPYNAFLITNPRFGLTVDEIRAELATVTTITDFAIEFLPSEEVVLKPSSTLASHALATHLSALKPSLATALAAKGLGTLQLAAADASLNILRREADDAADARDGWSRVAAKAAAPRRVVQYGSGVGSTNGFAALTGQKVTFARKKAESVVEDWEAAEAAEEERERGLSGDEELAAAAAAEPSVAEPSVAEPEQADRFGAEPVAEQGQAPPAPTRDTPLAAAAQPAIAAEDSPAAAPDELVAASSPAQG
ncbi:hypothetical protein BJ546DRAFT_918700 [Cryomyces antarcticus]